jgi:hypothetical protein
MDFFLQVALHLTLRWFLGVTLIASQEPQDGIIKDQIRFLDTTVHGQAIRLFLQDKDGNGAEEAILVRVGVQVGQTGLLAISHLHRHLAGDGNHNSVFLRDLATTLWRVDKIGIIKIDGGLSMSIIGKVIEGHNHY